MKTWLKGGLIGIAVFLILFALTEILQAELFALIIYFLALPVYLIIIHNLPATLSVTSPSTWYLIYIPTMIIYSFIMGAIIGLIIGKLKSK